MQLDPADFMSAAQTSTDRRERKVVLAGKRRLSACVCNPREGLNGTARQKEGSGAIHRKCINAAAAAAAAGMRVVAPHQTDRMKTVTGH